jgi:mannosyl-oligosaccharide glucosidase
LNEAILFQHLKKAVDETVDKYGPDNPPPPWQLFTIQNQIQDGNLHFVQKVFEGAFEVSWFFRRVAE